MEETKVATVCDNKNDGWAVIVITCATPKLCEFMNKACGYLKAHNLLPPHELLLVITDPHHEVDEHCKGVGSGGATINALLIAIENMSAQQGFTTISPDLIYTGRILLINHGREFAHCPGGTIMLPLDQKFHLGLGENTPCHPTLLQYVMHMATQISSKSSSGVWITTVDAFLLMEADMIAIDTSNVDGALILTVPVEVEQARLHGVVLSDEEKRVTCLEYRLGSDRLGELSKDGKVDVISGLVYLSPALSEKLVSFSAISPLDRCTYYGIDSGLNPLQISLYFDLLLPLSSQVTMEEYVEGKFVMEYNKVLGISKVDSGVTNARLQMWRILQGLSSRHESLSGCQYNYLGQSASFAPVMSAVLPTQSNHFYTEKLDNTVIVDSLLEGTIMPEGQHSKNYLINSWIGPKVILHSEGNVINGLYIQGFPVELHLGSDLLWQGYNYEESEIVTCYGISDHILVPYSNNRATVFNQSWEDFFTKTNLKPCYLWPSTTPELERNLYNAKLYEKCSNIVQQIRVLHNLASMQSPASKDWINTERVSLREVIGAHNLDVLLLCKDEIFTARLRELMSRTKDTVRGCSLQPYFIFACQSGNEACMNLLEALHDLLLSTTEEGPTLSTARLYAHISELLGCMAGPKGGLRSGPAANKEWTTALKYLEAGKMKEGVSAMLTILKRWLRSGKVQDIMRAARHYERAVQIMISQRVKTAETEVLMWKPKPQPLAKGIWVEATCPARLDLSGGWTDTPPICYEQGGAVLNIAIKINGVQPVGAKVRFVDQLSIHCTMKDWVESKTHLLWTSLEDIKDFDNPTSPGALIKAVLHYCKVVDVYADVSLEEQLSQRYGAGLEIETWSRLPQGSGLGTSSILAGGLVGAVATLLGYSPKPHHLIHSTLIVEQLLTTSGGWQDQVGGLLGGAKLGVSSQGSSLVVKSYNVPMDKQLLQDLNGRLLLLYTGKVRLARNLLQAVIRNWYAHDPTITHSFAQLRILAIKAATELLCRNLEGLGHCVGEYWTLKKMVATGCEPQQVTRLMAAMRSQIDGASLSGAGGGGYMYAIKSNSRVQFSQEQLEGQQVDKVEVDMDGLILRVGEEVVLKAGVTSVENLTPELLSRLREEAKNL
ncbi:L-fucose kinase-like isoform X2 [Oratosquilla oratoria]